VSVSLIVIQRNNNPLHKEQVGERGQTKKERRLRDEEESADGPLCGT
jgi:hypothetical protein